MNIAKRRRSLLTRCSRDHVASRLWRRLGERAPFARGTLTFVLSWVVLNALLNVRFPAGGSGVDFLLPSIDLMVVFSLFAGIGAARHWGSKRMPWLSALRVPRAALWSLALLCIAVRIFRVGDGVMEVWQSRNANVFGDLPMLEELVRLLHTTLPSHQFAGVAIATVLVLPSVALLSYTALRAASVYLAQPKGLAVFAGLVVVALALSPLGSGFTPKDGYRGVFVASLVPRVSRDWREHRRDREVLVRLSNELQAAQARMSRGSGDLAQLGGANVLLFIVESYGEVTLKEPELSRHMDRGYERYRRTLEDNGYHVASRVLDSSVIGGFSWLAHASMLTGVRVRNQAQYTWLREQQPKTLVDAFNGAGYRTVSAEPGTTRAMPPPELYDFDQRYYAPHFGYRGPEFSWAPMPDQYVLDRVHRALRGHRGSLFVKYAFVSSHAPWDVQPRLIHDWSKIGNGAIYHQLEPLRFPTSWTDFSQAAWPYARSILYTLDCIRLYIDKFVSDDTLIIIVGDHQPTTKFTRDNESAGVVMHVISRRAEFVDKFVARGYQRDMRPDLAAPRPGLWDFPGDFIEDFSTEAGAASSN